MVGTNTSSAIAFKLENPGCYKRSKLMVDDVDHNIYTVHNIRR